MGEVYRARDSASALKHLKIITSYEIGRTESTSFIATERTPADLP
jgi:hypothetical protein